MKKILSMLVVAGLLVALAGCETPNEVANDVGYNVPTHATERVNPPSFYNIPEYSSVTTAVFNVTDWGRDSDFTSMLSEIEARVIHIGEDTPIYLEDGTNVRELLEYMSYSWTLAEFLDGRILSVYYMMVLQSFPSQVYPNFVRVLESYDDLRLGRIVVEMVSGNIEVNGERLPILPRNYRPFWARGGYITEDGMSVSYAQAAMVPLKPIAEALGYELGPVDHDMPQRFNVGGATGQVGSLEVRVGAETFELPAEPWISEVRVGVETFELPAEPWINDYGVIFVPTEFFSDVLRYNVFVWRGV